MYKGASKNLQSKNARFSIAESIVNDETLTDEQKRENLVARLKALQRMRSDKFTIGKDAWKDLGREISEVGIAIGNIRPKKKAPGVENYFIDAARNFLTKSQFDIIMTKAVNAMKDSTTSQEV